MSAADARLFELLDGSRTLPELIAEAERLEGPARAGAARAPARRPGRSRSARGRPRRRNAAQPRAQARASLPAARARPARGSAPGSSAPTAARGGCSSPRPALAVLAALAVAGVGVFAYLIAGRYGTPFVVASKIGLGGLVFLARALRRGRRVHEVAHGLTMASFGRRVRARRPQAGLHLPVRLRRHVGGVVRAAPPADRGQRGRPAERPRDRRRCSRSRAWSSAPGTVRDIFFQLAFAAYVGAFFNLNPFLDRDGYHILVDVLREPGLRRRSREQFRRLLLGREPRQGDSPVLFRYAVAGVAWSVAAAGFAIVLSMRYYVDTRATGAQGRRVGRARKPVRDAVHARRRHAGATALAARALNCRRRSAVSESDRVDRAAELLERLLADADLRARFRAQPGDGVPGGGLPGSRRGDRADGRVAADARPPRVALEPRRRAHGRGVRRHGGARALSPRRRRPVRARPQRPPTGR